MVNRALRAVVRIQMMLLKLTRDSKPSDPGGEIRFSLSIGMVIESTAALVFGHSADLSHQILNAGFHSYPTSVTMVGRVGGRGFFLMTCQALGQGPATTPVARMPKITIAPG